MARCRSRSMTRRESSRGCRGSPRGRGAPMSNGACPRGRLSAHGPNLKARDDASCLSPGCGRCRRDAARGAAAPGARRPGSRPVGARAAAPGARARRGPRDAQDGAWLSVWAELAAGEVFTSGYVLAHAAVNPEFKALLERADCVGARDVGEVLRRCDGQVFEGQRLVRLGKAEDGVRWQFVPA